MSRLAHPNINAAALTADIFEAVESRLRGAAAEDKARALAAVNPALSPRLVGLVLAVSHALDEEFRNATTTGEHP